MGPKQILPLWVSGPKSNGNEGLHHTPKSFSALI